MPARRTPAVGLALGLAALLAGCGPVPVAQAERSCLDDARLAQGPRGSVSLGVVSDGGRVRPTTGLEVEVSGDYLAGRDPSAVFANCVQRRSGQAPTTPLYEQPGWRAR